MHVVAGLDALAKIQIRVTIVPDAFGRLPIGRFGGKLAAFRVLSCGVVPFPVSARRGVAGSGPGGISTIMTKQLLGLWRDTWWLWTGFIVLTIAFSFLMGAYFLLLLPCLPVPFVYFAINRYDEDGNEKHDLGA